MRNCQCELALLSTAAFLEQNYLWLQGNFAPGVVLQLTRKVGGGGWTVENVENPIFSPCYSVGGFAFVSHTMPSNCLLQLEIQSVASTPKVLFASAPCIVLHFRCILVALTHPWG